MTAAPAPADAIRRLRHALGTVMRGQDTTIRHLLAAFLSGGHVLLDDVPGTGKTTLAKALARAVHGRFTRIQFTPDLLPSDILGVEVYHQQTGAFVFHDGPIFTNFLLADEINRAAPRTQSALLEAMAEGQVSVEGARRALPDPFLVIATQNPVEFRGTYPLPEAQVDRFALQLRLGYLDLADECAMLEAQLTTHPLDRLEPCLTLDELMQVRRAAHALPISAELREYLVRLVAQTRALPGVRLGASPRASLALMRCAQALALIDGMDFVTPEPIQELAGPVLAHRLTLEPQASLAGLDPRTLIADLVARLPVPA